MIMRSGRNRICLLNIRFFGTAISLTTLNIGCNLHGIIKIKDSRLYSFSFLIYFISFFGLRIKGQHDVIYLS